MSQVAFSGLHSGPVGFSGEVLADEMLRTGEIDALFSAHVPPSARKSPQLVQRLFPDFETVERDYFSRTGIFPIMHTVVIRRDFYEQNRWVARAIMAAFEQAKAIKS